jgi:hypothetical protein
MLGKNTVGKIKKTARMGAVGPNTGGTNYAYIGSRYQ